MPPRHILIIATECKRTLTYLDTIMDTIMDRELQEYKCKPTSATQSNALVFEIQWRRSPLHSTFSDILMVKSEISSHVNSGAIAALHFGKESLILLKSVWWSAVRYDTAPWRGSSAFRPRVQHAPHYCTRRASLKPWRTTTIRPSTFSLLVQQVLKA